MFRQTNTLTTGTDAVEKRGIVAKMMKAWEAKATKRAANATGFTLMAVSLAACNDDAVVPAIATADIPAEVTAAVREAATDLGVVGASTMTNAQLFTAIKEVNDAAVVSSALRDAAANLGVTGTSTMTDAELVTAIKVVNDAAITAGVDVTADNAAAVTTALRAAAKDLGVTGTAEMTNAQLITAIQTQNDASIMVSNDAAVVTAALKSAADAAGVTGTATMTDAQLIAALTTSNDASAIDSAVVALGIAGVSTLADLAAAYDELANPPVTNQQFTLTTAQDLVAKFTGGAGDDTFSAVVTTDNGTGTTIAAGDSLAGGAGTDTLNISVSGAHGAGVTVSAVQTVGIEKVLVSNFNTGAFVTTIDTTLMTGVTNVGLTASSANGDTTFSGMNNFVAAEMRNGTGDLTLTYNGAQAVTGAADSQSLTVANVTAGTFKADGIETINITAETAKSTLKAVASSALKTLNISGSQDIKITDAVDFVAGTNNDTTIDATIDAASLTGKLTVTADQNDTKITGGLNDDTINMVGHLTKNDIIDGGAGNNTLTMNAATISDQFSGVKNIQNVIFNDSGSAVNIAANKVAADVQKITLTLKDDDTGGDVLESTVAGLTGQTVVVTRVDEDADVNGQVDVTLTSLTDTLSDSINIELLAVGVNGDEVGDTDGDENGLGALNVASFETVNLVSSKSETVSANELFTLSATLAKAVVVSGNADLTIGSITGGAMTSFNASGLAGKLTATFASDDKVTATAAQKDTTFNFGSTLDNNDIVVGGAGKDTVSATVTGLTATTGKLNISGVETVALTTSGNNVIDLSGVTGASSVSVSANTQIITGLDLASKLIATDNATLKVTAANATGSNDTLTVEQKVQGDVTNVIEGKAIENLSLILNDTGATANSAAFTLSDFEGTKITVAESATTVTSGANVNLGSLHKNVTSVDAATTKGTFAASAANSTAAVTFNLNGAAADTVTGSAKDDTFNIAETGNVSHTITGGDGADVANVAVKNGYVTGENIAVETINYTVKAGDDITLTGVNNTNTTTISLAGGNALSTFTTAANGIVNELKLFDASNFGGNVVLSVTKNIVDDTVTFKGGTSTKDEIEYQIDGAGTDKLYSSGIEILDLDIDATSTLDLANATGVKTVDVDAAGNIIFTVDKLIGTEPILVSDADDTAGVATVEAKLADASGSADAISFELKAAGDIKDGTKLKTTDIETVNLKVSSAESVSLAEISMATADKVMSLNVTGDKALTISALNADVTTIDAAGMSTGGSIVQTGRSSTAAADYKGSAGADTFIMANTSDVIVAGAGADTLDVNLTAVLGGIVVDLSKDDVVVSANGVLNTTVQSGFTNVDLAGYTGGFGSVVTAHKDGSTITGTAFNDQIVGGAGADTINATAGNDVVSGGAGTDTFNFTAALIEANDGTTATYDGGDGVDTVVVTGATTGLIDADLDGFSNMETLKFAAGDNTLTAGQLFNGAFKAIDITGAIDLVVTQDTGDALGSAANPLQILGYTVNAEDTRFDFLGDDAASDEALADFTVENGLYTDADGTVADFFTKAAAGFDAGDVGLFHHSGNTYVFAEGAATTAGDDVHLEVLGLLLTSVSETEGPLVLHIS